MNQDHPAADVGLRITAVAGLTGLSVHTIRAWERRYGVPSPPRSSGRQRLYTRDDVAALQRMHELSRSGMPLSSAASIVRQERESATTEATSPPLGILPTVTAFVDSLLTFNEARANDCWNEYFAATDLGALLRNIAVPALHEIGDRWHAGTASVSQEHFASNFVRSRLEALARQHTVSREAPTVLLACLPGDWHEIGILMLHVTLRFRGLRTVYLGQAVPFDDLVRTTEDLQPNVIAVHGSEPSSPDQVSSLVTVLAETAPLTRVVYGGAGFEDPSTPFIPGARFGGRGLAEAADVIETAARER